jgi:hypothetical protein
MCYHVSYSFEPCLSTEEGSGAVTCLTALDIASLLKRVPMLTRVLQLWTPPPHGGGFWCHHVSRDSEIAFLLRRAPVLARVSQLSEGRESKE